MKTAPIPIWTSQSLPATGIVNSNPYPTFQAFGYAVQVTWAGTPTGTFTLQASCDVGVVNPSTGAVTGVSNWTTLADTSSSASGSAGSAIYNIADVMYLWFRLVYTASSGTGTAVANASVKGV